MIMRWKVRLKFRILRLIGVPQRKVVVGEELIPSLTTLKPEACYPSLPNAGSIP